MKIKKIVAGLRESEDFLGFKGKSDLEVSSLAYDSQRVMKGSLFMAVKGDVSDGHAYINEAFDRGAVSVVVQDPAYYNVLDSAILVRDSRCAMARIANLFFDYPSRRLKVFGITGTNGKTTTSYILREILETAGISSGLIGTISCLIGEKEFTPLNTTPEAIDIACYFDEMLKYGHEAVVMEVSSHALLLGRVEGIDYTVGIFTNLTRDHLDFHGDMESYFESKRLLFKDASILSVINFDDPYGRRLFKDRAMERCIGFAMNGEADIMAIEPKICMDGVSFTAKTPVGTFKCSSRLLGLYNVYNILAAIGAALWLNIPLENIKRGIERLSHVPGRFELIRTLEGISAVVDYAHTDDALKSLLDGVRPLAVGRVITIFGCGGDRDSGKRPLMGMAASSGSDLIVVTSDNPRSEAPQKIIDDILAGVAAMECCSVIPDRREAIRKALSLARPGDIIVLAGKGHENYQILNSGRIEFSDRVEMLNAMRDTGLGVMKNV